MNRKSSTDNNHNRQYSNNNNTQHHHLYHHQDTKQHHHQHDSYKFCYHPGNIPTLYSLCISTIKSNSKLLDVLLLPSSTVLMECLPEFVWNDLFPDDERSYDDEEEGEGMGLVPCNVPRASLELLPECQGEEEEEHYDDDSDSDNDNYRETTQYCCTKGFYPTSASFLTPTTLLLLDGGGTTKERNQCCIHRYILHIQKDEERDQEVFHWYTDNVVTRQSMYNVFATSHHYNCGRKKGMEYMSSSSFVINEENGSVVGIVNGYLVVYTLPLSLPYSSSSTAAEIATTENKRIKLHFFLPSRIQLDCILLPSVIPHQQPHIHKEEKIKDATYVKHREDEGNDIEFTDCFYAVGYHKQNRRQRGNNRRGGGNQTASTCHLLSIHSETGSVFLIPNHNHGHDGCDDDYLPGDFTPSSFLQCVNNNGGTSFVLVGSALVDNKIESVGKKGKECTKKKKCTLIYHGCIARNYNFQSDENENSSGGGGNDIMAMVPFVVHWKLSKLIKPNDISTTGAAHIENSENPDDGSAASFLSLPSDCNVSLAYSRSTNCAVLCLNAKKYNKNDVGGRESNFVGGGFCGDNPAILESRDGGATWINITSPHNKQSRGIINGMGHRPPVLAFMPSSPWLLSNGSKEEWMEEKERLFAFGYDEEHCRLTEMKHILRSKNDIVWPKMNVYECRKDVE